MAELPKFVTGDGEIITPNTPEDAAKLRMTGLDEASDQAIHIESLREQYSSWAYAPLAVASGLVQGIPGASTLLLAGAGLADGAEGAQNVGDAMAGLDAAFPKLSGAGQLAGSLGASALTLGTAGAAAGAGAVAAAGAGTGALYTADQLAMDHATTPEGAENIAAQLGVGAVVGAVTSLATMGLLKGAGSLLKKAPGAGKALQDSAEKLQMGGLLTSEGVAKMEADGSIDAVREYATKNKIYKMDPTKAKEFIQTRLRAATGQLEEAKAAFSAPIDFGDQLVMANELRAQLAGLQKPLQVALKAFDGGYDLNRLHVLRQKLDKLVNWGDPTSAYSKRIMGARDTVNRVIDTYVNKGNLAGPEMAEQARRWYAGNAEYATLSKMRDSLVVGRKAGRSMLGSLGVGGAGVAGAAASALGVPFGVVAGAGAVAGAASSGAARKAGAWSLEKLGGALLAADHAMVQHVSDGLMGEAGRTLAVAAAGAAIGSDSFESIRTGLLAASDRPDDAAIGVATALEDQGLPGEVVDALMPQQLAAMQYLQAALPRSPFIGQSVAPSTFLPSREEKLAFMDKVAVVNDPSLAVREPNAARMATLEAVYPSIAQRVKALAAAQAATRPDLPAKGRQWAAAVLGGSASPLSTPAMFYVLQTAPTAAQQAAQRAAAGPKQSGVGAAESVTLTPSRLDRMASKGQ